MSLKKTSRLVLIKQLISKHEISNQEDLVHLLAERGVHATQATISRDLKQLNVAKGFTPSGQTCYVLPNEVFYRRPKADLSEDEDGRVYTDSVSAALATRILSIDFSFNLAVIRTKPGYAGSVAYDIDEKNWSGILGSVAGDDTVLLILAEGVGREMLIRELGVLLEGVETQKTNIADVVGAFDHNKTSAIDVDNELERDYHNMSLPDKDKPLFREV